MSLPIIDLHSKSDKKVRKLAVSAKKRAHKLAIETDSEIAASLNRLAPEKTLLASGIQRSSPQ